MKIVVLAASGHRDGFRAQGTVKHLASLGWDITVVGTLTSHRTEAQLGLVETVLLPVVPLGGQHLQSASSPFAYDSRETAISRGREIADERAQIRARGDSLGIVYHLRRGWVAAAAKVHSLRMARTLDVLRERESARIAEIEHVMGREVVSLSPDLIHVYGAANLPAATMAARELRRVGKSPLIVYEALQSRDDAVDRTEENRPRGEAQNIGDVNVVVVGWPDLADRLAMTHQLRTPPVVIARADRKCPGKGINNIYESELGELAPLLGRKRLSHSISLSRKAADELLAHANSAMSEHDVAAAVGFQDRASRILFSRELNLVGAASPIARSPKRFLGAWNESTVVQRISGGTSPVTGPRGGGRVLLLTDSNTNFLQSLTQPLNEEFDSVETLVLSTMTPQLSTSSLLRSRLGDQLGGEDWAGRMTERLAEYDTLVVDWCDRGAVVVSMLAPPSCRLLVRLHSFEAFTSYPHLVDWSRVDDLVFVGEHLRRLVVEAVPATRQVRSHIIPIPTEVSRFRLPKLGEASKALGLVGWASPAKDVPWALEVLRQLRQRDREFTLQLIGDPPDPGSWPEYAECVSECLATAGGSVKLVPKTNDVPTALRSVGFILSTSVRESLHLGLAEGAASGAVPVVRDWPALRSHGGARSVFPADWLVETPDEAVERVISLGEDFDRLLAGSSASRWVQEHMNGDIAADLWRDVFKRVSSGRR